MAYLLGLIILVVGLLVSVILHEFGHLGFAKLFGVLVPECWAGFGKTLWSKRIGQTTYGFKAIPLGGYVRILGMYPPAKSGAKTLRKNGDPTMAELARRDSQRELEEAAAVGLTGKPLWQVSPWKKAVIIAAGPLVNLALAFVFLAVVVVGFGSQVATTTLEAVNTDSSAGATAAADAGLQAGDEVVAWNGETIDSWEQLRQLIAENGAETATIQVVREGEILEFLVTPEVSQDTVALGIQSQVGREHGTFGETLSATGQQVILSGKAIFSLPVNLWNTMVDLFTGQERSPESVVSVVGVARVAGEITSVDSASSGGEVTWVDRASMLCALLASLNIALFVFNLIPLPPLDGGHFVAAIWGMLKNLFSRLRGRVATPVDAARAVPLSSFVFGVLILISVVLVAADLINPITLFQQSG